MPYPVLELLQTRLPLKLREKVYENLVDPTIPIVVPKIEGTDRALHLHSDGLRQHPTIDLNPFGGNRYFDSHIVGPHISEYIQALALRKTPFYFRGCRNAPDVKSFLDIQLKNGTHIRDHIRLVRVYLRCESFSGNAVYPQTPNSSHTSQTHLPIALDEEARYAMYASRLRGLHTLNYTKHKVSLEICVFYSAAVLRNHDNRYIKRNLFECVKPAYYSAKVAGADARVRGEDFMTGRGEDWTLCYERDKKESAIACLLKSFRPLRLSLLNACVLTFLPVPTATVYIAQY
jgi:hypothetical protein